jgi:hypothetical protein
VPLENVRRSRIPTRRSPASRVALPSDDAEKPEGGTRSQRWRGPTALGSCLRWRWPLGGRLRHNSIRDRRATGVIGGSQQLANAGRDRFAASRTGHLPGWTGPNYGGLDQDKLKPRGRKERVRIPSRARRSDLRNSDHPTADRRQRRHGRDQRLALMPFRLSGLWSCRWVLT